MNITLYLNNSPNEYLNKQLRNARTFVCSLIYPFDVENPRVKLSVTDNIDFNYASLNVDGITRYYYIDNRIIENQTITFILKEDYLMTWQSNIIMGKGLITRSKRGNKYINDNMATKTQEVAWKFRDLGTCFTSKPTVIFIKGGGV